MDYTTLDYQHWSRLQIIVRKLLSFIFQITTHMIVDGLDNVPTSGPIIVAINHLHIIDTPIGITVLPRRVIIFAKDKWRHVPIINWFLRNIGSAIFVGKSDSLAFDQAVLVLRSGGALGMAPEGTRSKNGKLNKGRSGISRMAINAPAPVLPMVIYGHENIWNNWKRLGRPNIYVKLGKVIIPPKALNDEFASAEQARNFAEVIMSELASLLPTQYRGAYEKKENTDKG